MNRLSFRSQVSGHLRQSTWIRTKIRANQASQIELSPALKTERSEKMNSLTRAATAHDQLANGQQTFRNPIMSESLVNRPEPGSSYGSRHKKSARNDRRLRIFSHKMTT